MSTLTTKKMARLAVIVSDFGAAANIGGSVETKVRVFDVPQEIKDYIDASRGQWSTVALAVEDEA